MQKKFLYLSLIFILMIAGLVRIYPFSVGSFGGPDPLYHARMADLFIDNQSLPEYDALSMQGRPYTYSPLFHISLALFSMFSGIPAQQMIGIYPVIYGVLAVLLVFVLSRRLFNSDKIAIFSSLFLATMGLHIVRTFSYARPDGLAITLIIAAIFFLTQRNMKALAFISIVLVLLHPLSSLYLLLFMLLASLGMKFFKKPFQTTAVFAAIAMAFLVYLLWLFSLPVPLDGYLSEHYLGSTEINELTFISFLYFLSFAWIFFIIGFVKLKEKFFEKMWFLFSLLFGFFALRLFIYFAPVASLFAGFGFVFVLEKVKKYRKHFFAVIFIFISITLLTTLISIDSFPTQKTRHAMNWLNESTSSDSVVAARWDAGHLITGMADRTAFIDGYFEFAPRLDERADAVEDLMMTSDCSLILSVSQVWGIDYVFLHPGAVSSRSYIRGILEADCENMNLVFDNGSRIIELD